MNQNQNIVTSTSTSSGFAPAANLIEANRMMRHICREEREIAKIHASAEALRDDLRKELAEIDKWEAEQSASHEKQKRFFSSLLTDYVRKELEGTKKKSVALVGGRAGWSPKKEEFIFPTGQAAPGASNKALLDFVKTNGLSAFVETKESVKWGEMRKALTSSPDGLEVSLNGVKIPGLARKTCGSEFYVKVDEDSPSKG
jgi:hypothetical protein